MTRQIFIGSSTESLKEAEAVRTLLESFPDTKCVLWNTLFEPGSLTFEVLEQMLTRCSAAVFIATPDDQSVIRGRKIMTPRSNVVLEFGLVAGRLGRHRIALCQYGDAELPSDLRGLTVVEMGSRGSTDISQRTSDNLRIWTARPSATAEGISPTQLVHGYTGNWEFALDLTTWRDMTIVRPDYAYVKGSLQIFIPWMVMWEGDWHTAACFSRLLAKMDRSHLNIRASITRPTKLRAPFAGKMAP
jgi:hypothetical protein